MEPESVCTVLTAGPLFFVCRVAASLNLGSGMQGVQGARSTHQGISLPLGELAQHRAGPLSSFK